MPRYLSLIILAALAEIVFSIYYAGKIVQQNQLLSQQQQLYQKLLDQNLESKSAFYRLNSLDNLLQYQRQKLLFPLNRQLKPYDY